MKFGDNKSARFFNRQRVFNTCQGLKAVRESDGGTEADEGVQRLIRRRIGGYPDEAKANMHHARSAKITLKPVAVLTRFKLTFEVFTTSAFRRGCHTFQPDKHGLYPDA